MRRDFDQKPRDDRIPDRNVASIAPLQLTEERLRIHHVVFVTLHVLPENAVLVMKTRLMPLENLRAAIKIEIGMKQQSIESKRLLSHIIAEWVWSLKYEHLSPEAVQAAKLFWFDSIGCALGGSQQDDARILLKHHRAMSATADSSAGEGGKSGNGKAT